MIKDVKILSLDHFGRGIAKIDNKIIFVNNALEDEIVDIKIIKDTKKYSIAEVLEYKKTSNNRREVKCKYYNTCGGCNIMHMNYEKQLLFKKEKVINILKKYSNIDINPEVIKSNKEYNYRNKVTFHIKDNVVGYYKNNSNDIIKIDNCLLLNNLLNDNIKLINKDNLILRCNNNEVINNEKDNEIIKEINEFKFKVNINSFFQVNDYICSCIFNIIKENINNNEIVLDLYAGVGTLGIVSSSSSKKVISVEENQFACKNIEENKELNNINNLEVVNKKVEDFVKEYKNNASTIVLDPPRSGVKSNVIDFINDSNINKIIYISCDPMTLARDLNLLKGFNITKSYILDMFPNTYHVESMIVLEKK